MHLLYIEDNPNDADLTKRELHKTAPWLHIDVVSTKSEALERLNPMTDMKYQLVLTDMRLPDGDGLAILAHIRRNNLPLAVVVITGSSDEQTAVIALQAGADDYIVKRSNYQESLPVILEQAVHRFRTETTRGAHPLRLLYAEPNATDADLTCRHMVQFAPHIHLDIVHTATEVVQRLMAEQFHGVYDMLLMDYRLPDSSALEVLKELYQVYQMDIPVVLVTSRGSQEIVVQALRLGAADYVVKETDYLYRLPLVLENALQRYQLSRERTALRESEARYRIVSELTSDFAYAFTINGDGKFISQWVTDAFQRITQIAPETLNGGNGLNQLVHPDDTSIAQQHQQMVVSGKTDISEFRILTKTGATRWLRDCCKPIFDKEQNRVTQVYGAARDITEWKQMEHEQKFLESQARQAQKMEAVGALAGGIAHDFNNVLTGIIGYTELAKILISSEPKADSHLQHVLDAAQRAKEMVQQILTFSRQSELERQPISLQAVVEEALKLLRATLPTTIQIQPHLSAHNATVLADKTQIHQILMNLCTNAEHAMRIHGGVLDIRLENVEVTQELMTANPALRLKPYVRLTVSDTGQGIPKELQDNIFEPFLTTKDVGEGTGMGLAVVHGIVTSHDGAIIVESTPEVGTAFQIYFPCVSNPPEQVLLDSETIPQGNERIVFIDDEEILARLGYELLTNLGYHVRIYSNSLEALEAIRNDIESIDLVITDQTMPELTGEELARDIIGLRPNLPIILCTGFSYALTSEKVKAMGIRAYHMKPLDFRELAVTVREVLDEENEAVSMGLYNNGVSLKERHT